MSETRLAGAGERCCAGHPRAENGLRVVLAATGLAAFFLTGQAWAWEIQSFDVDLAVQPDSSVRVTETIRADFQGEPRHGIYRDIPLVTQDRMGVRHSIRLNFLGAVDENDQPWKAKGTNEGVYRRIRLGSQDQTYTGLKTFKISYQVQRIVQSFPDHDELYWNVTGNQWAVPMQWVRAAVRLPPSVPAGRLRAASFTGPYGSRASDAKIQINDGEVRCAASRVLEPFEGLTLAVGWPNGVTRMPGRWRRIGWFLQDNWGFEIPLLVLALMFGIWWKFGRDLPRENITVQYEPPDALAPAEIGALIDDRIDLRDITATIVDLARRGYLTIEELQHSDYILTRKGHENIRKDLLKPHEALLLGSLFQNGSTIRLSDLENKFYQHLPAMRTAVYDGLVKNGYWWSRPDRVRKFWVTIAWVVFFAGSWVVQWQENIPVLLALWVSAGIIACFARFMPRKTVQGTKTMEKVLGFEEFLRRTDEDRIRRASDPAALFERMLPYALAFGVAGQWAKAFESIYQVSPVWYTSTSGGTFTPGDFTRRLNSASTRMGAALASAPRSSGGSGFGGGFSGGGGGGGGGGSW